jgi:hypothetical protein
LVVVMLVVTVVVQAVPPDNAWERMLPVLFQGLTLLFIFWTSDVRRRTMVGVCLFVVVSLIVGGTATGTANGAERWLPQGVGAIMALAGPVVIVRFIQRQGRITLQSLWGALSIYLLAGLFFAYMFAIVAAASSHNFFAQNPSRGELSIDYIYFSFVTLTTVGYGDLTAAQSFGKMLAVSEALMGQLYLVGVVALVASNIGMTFSGKLRATIGDKDAHAPTQEPAEAESSKPQPTPRG